jgi:hypothetical protein
MFTWTCESTGDPAKLKYLEITKLTTMKLIALHVCLLLVKSSKTRGNTKTAKFYSRLKSNYLSS